MDAQSKKCNIALAPKRGPKKGWLDDIKAQRDYYDNEARCLRDAYFRQGARVEEANSRITNFNNMSTWAKLLFILKGGHV